MNLEHIRAIAEAGHEIAHHSYFHENTIGMDAKTEAAMLDLGLAALWDVAGVRPAGWPVAPSRTNCQPAPVATAIPRRRRAPDRTIVTYCNDRSVPRLPDARDRTLEPVSSEGGQRFRPRRKISAV